VEPLIAHRICFPVSPGHCFFHLTGKIPQLRRLGIGNPFGCLSCTQSLESRTDLGDLQGLIH
jgi:hypothetical protein